jgi:hypothetical protein
MAATGAVVVSNPVANNTTGAIALRFSDPHGLERARDRTDVGTGCLRLFQGARFAPRHIYRHAQHVAEREQHDAFVQCQLNRLVHIFFGADTHGTTGTCDQLDLLGQRSAQARSGN